MEATEKDLSLNDVGAFLVSQGFDLTALELLQEAVELGKEAEVVTLREHFNNQKFADALQKKEAVSLLDQVDDATLVQELREQVIALLLPPKDSSMHNAATNFPLTTLEKKLLNSLIQNHLITLNCRASAICFTQEIGEKAVASYEEILHRWGIASDGTKIPSLTKVFRYYLTGANPSFALSLFDELDKKQKELNDAKEEISSLRESLKKQQELITEKDNEIKQLKNELESQLAKSQKFEKSLSFSNLLSNAAAMPSVPKSQEPEEAKQADHFSSSSNIPNAASSDKDFTKEESEDTRESTSLTLNPGETEESVFENVEDEKSIPLARRQESSHFETLTKFHMLLEKEEMRLHGASAQESGTGDSIFIAQQVNRLSSLKKNYGEIVSLLSQCLPRITKGVILPKREELLPLILVGICWNDDKDQRLELTSLLFHLIRIPTFEQRRMIMTGCVWLASLSDPERTANELLPQCWENVDSEFEERRLLVADSCGFLASKVKPELRFSLLLSILTQLSDDLSPSVRSAAALNLGRILLAERKCESLQKFSQVESLVHKFLKDSEESVVKIAETTLVVIFIDWAIANNLFYSLHCEGYLKRAFDLCQRVYDERSLRSPLSSSHDSGHEATTEPAPVKITPKDLKEVLFNFENLQSRLAGVLTSDDKPGPALAFISSSLLPQLSRILSLLDIANIAVLKAIFSLLSLINEKIGSHVILEEFLPLLSSQVLNTEEEMKALKESSPPQPKRESMELEDSDDEVLLEEDKFSSLRRRRTWLTCGILCCLVNFSSRPDWEMKFKDSIVLIAREESDWKDTDVAVFQSVFGVTQALDPERLDHFVHLLIEMSTHNSQRCDRYFVARVQNLSVKLVSILAQQCLSERQIIDLVLPLFGALSNNAQGAVKIGTLTALSQLLTVTNNIQIVSTAKNQIDAIVKQSSRKTHREVVRIFSKILNDVPRQLRDEFILPHLYQFAKANQDVDSPEAKKKMIEILYKIFRRIAHDVLSPQTKKDFVIPTLEILQTTIGNDPQDTAIRSEVGNLLVELRGAGGASAFGFLTSRKVEDETPDTSNASSTLKKSKKPATVGEDSDSDSFSDKIEADELLEQQLGSLSNAISAKFSSFFKK